MDIKNIYIYIYFDKRAELGRRSTIFFWLEVEIYHHSQCGTTSHDCCLMPIPPHQVCGGGWGDIKKLINYRQTNWPIQKHKESLDDKISKEKGNPIFCHLCATVCKIDKLLLHFWDMRGMMDEHSTTCQKGNFVKRQVVSCVLISA